MGWPGERMKDLLGRQVFWWIKSNQNLQYPCLDAFQLQHSTTFNECLHRMKFSTSNWETTYLRWGEWDQMRLGKEHLWMQGKFKSLCDYPVRATRNKITPTGDSSHSARKLWEMTASQGLLPDTLNHTPRTVLTLFVNLPKWFWCTYRFGKKKHECRCRSIMEMSQTKGRKRCVLEQQWGGDGTQLTRSPEKIPLEKRPQEPR